MKTFLAATLATLALTACAPTINPAMRQRTDELVARYSDSRRTFPAAGAFRARDWAPGQFLVLRTTHQGKPAVQRLRVLRAEGGGFVLENDIQDYYGRTVNEMTFRRQPRTPDEARDAIIRMTLRREGEEPQVYDFEDPNNPMAGMMRDALRSSWQNLILQVQEGAPRETVSVPAGTFEGATGMRSTVSALGMTKHFEGYVHPAVPINGAVRSRSTDGEMTSELLDFGQE